MSISAHPNDHAITRKSRGHSSGHLGRIPEGRGSGPYATHVPVWAALLVFLLASVSGEVVGQDQGDEGAGLTCAWCVTIWDPEGTIMHVFVEGGEECGWVGHDIPRVECVRCGRTSTCHDPEGPASFGKCHIPCGPAGDDVAQVFDEVSETLERGHVVAVASLLHKERDRFSITYLPEEGRIVLALSCGGGRPYQTIPVLPEVREALEASIATYGQPTS